MFISNSLFISGLVLALTGRAYAHTLIEPALGVTGTGARSDVQRPSAAVPCGKTAISTLATSTAVKATGGAFSVTVQNFNGGKDGSTQVTAKVDATGTGKTFVAATVTKNGVLAPAAAGSAQVTVQMPAGTTCTGGADGKTCLVSFTTAGNFGNCVAVSNTATGAAAGAAAVAPAVAASSAVAAAPATATSKAAKGTKGAKGKANKAAAKAANPVKRGDEARNARQFTESLRMKRANVKRAATWVWAPAVVV